jgi:hypothetical protein
LILKVVAVSEAQETNKPNKRLANKEHEELCKEVAESARKVLELNGKDIVFTKPTE